MRGRLAAWLIGGAAATGAVLLGAAPPATAAPYEPRDAQVIAAGDAERPADADPRWQRVRLPDHQTAPVAWYRVDFELRRTDGDTLRTLYLPYFYGGGRIWLNGRLVAVVPESDEKRRVRWERPLLLPLPAAALADGRNVLHVRAASAHVPSGTMLPIVVVGAHDEVQPMFDRRLFFVRTVPVITVVVGIVGGLLIGAIWLQRRHEVLYGLAALASVLWGLRTTTFVFDTMPADWWAAWRLVYHASNGAFIVVLCLMGIRLARWPLRWPAIGLGAYWAVGPLVYLVVGPDAERWVSRWWVAGLIPVGIAAAVIAVIAAVKRPKSGTIAIAAAMSLALVTGVHDYLVAWRSPTLEAIAPQWAGHRFFLLHYGADVLLLTFGTLLVSRFVRSLRRAEEAKRTLEARVAASEHEIAATYGRIATLLREHAVLDERQRIMRDLHDGLGAQLFTSLSRAERGALPPAAMADALRGAIDEMRVAIEALASDEQDFRTAFGNFRFRWDTRLRDAGLVPHWSVELPDEDLTLAPHDTLQVLRIAQEALANVVKHARATAAQVRLALAGTRLVLEVADDGRGGAPSRGGGRGIGNMHARAARLGAALEAGPATGGGWRVHLEVELGADAPAAPAAPAAAIDPRAEVGAAR